MYVEVVDDAKVELTVIAFVLEMIEQIDVQERKLSII